MRREDDVRQARLRDVLPHELDGQDEVLDQERRREVQGPEGRHRMRRHVVELL
jgi:hypothetical protein